MSSSTLITPFSAQHTISYADELISYFWEKNPSIATATATNPTQQSLLNELSQCTDAVICIQTQALGNNPTLLSALFKAAFEKNNRIYLLLNKKEDCLRALAGHCLIRYTEPNIEYETFILINPKQQNQQKGFFLNTSLANIAIADAFMLGLDAIQIEELFVLYCYSFWQQANFELIAEADFNQPKNRLEANIEHLVPEKKYPPLSNRKFKYFHCPNWKDSFWAHLNTSHSVLIVERTLSADSLNTLINNNNTIHSLKNSKLHFVLSEDIREGILFSNNQQSSFFLKLNAVQAQKLKSVFDLLQKQADFFFEKQKKLSDLLGKTIIITTKQAPKELLVQENSTPALSNIQLSRWLDKIDFEKQRPNFPNSNQNYLSIQYTWEITPFYLPKGAKKHALYNEWDACESAYAKACEKVETFLEGNYAILLKNTAYFSDEPALKRAFLNLKQLKLNLPTLAQFEKDTSKAEKSYQYLKYIFSEIGSSVLNINRACLELAQEKEEKLQAQHEAENAKAKAQAMMHLNTFLKDNNLPTADLNLAKENLETNKQHKLLSEIKELEALTHKSEDKYKPELQELRKLISTLEDFKQKLQHTLPEEKESDLVGLNQPASPTQKSNTSTPAEFIPNLIIPKDNLPDASKFTLYEAANQNYLPIKYWEDSEIGKEAAARLNATLCVCPSGL